MSFWAGMRPWLAGYKTRLIDQRLRFVRVEHESEVVNAFHCCIHKSGSQWIRGVLTDPRVYRYGGLRPWMYHAPSGKGYDTRSYREKRFTTAFPKGTIASPFYVGYPTYAEMPKQGNSRAFFVARDPRDVVVSGYFSTRFSHGINPTIASTRADLDQQSEEDGLIAVIDRYERSGLFWALESWLQHESEPSILIVRYEDLVGDEGERWFGEIATHLDIQLPDQVRSRVWDDHSFAARTGRSSGEEDISSHERKGVAGDWRRHFTPRVSEHLEKVAGDLVRLYDS